MKLKYAILILALTLAFEGWGQEDNSKREGVVYLSTADLFSSYNVDARLFNSTGIEPVMDSLRNVQPNAYPIMGQWCRVQRLRINRMINSLQNDYTTDGSNIWMDSLHCITDASAYIATMQQKAEFLQSESERYEKLETERIENERRAAEARAKAEAQRIQREKDLKLATAKDSIKSMHRRITTICDAKTVTDKATIKYLKDIFYAYLAIYNRYDLTGDNTSDSRFDQLDELQQFQNHILDSVLGPNSYADRIEAFKNTLHARAGKNHTDVYKSYMRVFKKVNIPIGFKTIAEYNSYIEQLHGIMSVQQSYIETIEIRDTINRNTTELQNLCSKKHRDIFSAYKELLNETDLVPAFVTTGERDNFIGRLNEFVTMQHNYRDAIRRIDAIQQRGDSIVNACPKNISDVATAYKELSAATDFVPRFINQNSTDRFNADLDNFEEMQRLYASIIEIRKEIDVRTDKIVADKNAPRGLIPGYKQMMKYTDFTPHFTNISAGEEFIRLLNNFESIQSKFLKINDNNLIITNNTKQFKVSFKEFTNIHKAYERLLKTYDYELSIISEADINTCLKNQEAIIAMQQKFIDLANSLEKQDYDNRLKRVKEPDKIKLIMGVN
jgi:hypothetical protein